MRILTLPKRQRVAFVNRIQETYCPSIIVLFTAVSEVYACLTRHHAYDNTVFIKK